MIEIAESDVRIKMTREPIRIAFRIPRTRMGQQTQASDKALTETVYTIPQQHEKYFRPFTAETPTNEFSFSTCDEHRDGATNTDYHIIQNKIVQTTFEAETANMDDRGKERLAKFLFDVSPLVEDAIVTNEAFNIYEDDLYYSERNAERREPFNDQEELMVIKELKCFEYDICKQKIVSQIRFQPGTDLVAVSFRDPMSFEEHIETQCRNSESFLMIWNVGEFHRFTPVAILNCSLEVTSFNFKPDMPTLLVVGASNGQIFLYDLSELSRAGRSDPDGKPQLQREGSLSGKALGQNRDSGEIVHISPFASSALLESFAASQNLSITEPYSRKLFHLASHRSAVTAIRFLPSGLELERKNPLNLIKSEEGAHRGCDQFLSLSEDGQVLFWDLCGVDRPDPRGVSHEQRFVWRAMLSFQLFSPDLTYQQTRGLAEGPFQGTELFVCAEENELFTVNFDFRLNRNEELNKVEVQRRSWETFCRVSNIFAEVSSLFPGLYLVVNEISFSLFSNKSTAPLFVSALVPGTRITCARFSASRASVIYVGREDGIIDVWDLTDQTNGPSQQHLVSAVGVSFIETNERKPYLLSVGDRDGCLHLLQLPKSLVRSGAGEERALEKIIEKELNRIEYYKQRLVSVDPSHNKDQFESEAISEGAETKGEEAKGILSQPPKSSDDIIEESYLAFIEENLEKVDKLPAA